MEKAKKTRQRRIFFSTEHVESNQIFHTEKLEKTRRTAFPLKIIHFPHFMWITLNRIKNNQSLLLIAAVMSRMLSMISRSLLSRRDSTFWREDRTVVWSRPNS